VTAFVQEPMGTGYGFGSSTLVAGLILVPFSVTGLLASRTMGPVMRRSGATAVLIGGSLTITAAGVFFALLHGALWEAFVTMGVIGVGFGYTFAAIPGLVTRAVPGEETGSAMGFYQVVRAIGFSIGSALAASILAGQTVGGQPAEQGYVTALWLGSGVCAIAAVSSWALSRGGGMSAATTRDAELERLAMESAELGVAGVMGVERD
jgi:MFS family permease